jgi:hypothetical protein
VACNAWQETLPFRIPLSPTGRPWRRAIDTAQESPDDIVPLDDGPKVPVNYRYPVAAFSMLVLVSEAFE